MYSFIPIALIILSIAGILTIVLRKTPRVQEFVLKTPFSKLPGRFWEIWGQAIWNFLKIVGKKIWGFILDVKGLRNRAGGFGSAVGFFEKFHLPKLPIRKPNLRLFQKPDSPDFFLQQAQESIDREDFVTAEQKFIKVIEKDPRNELAFAGLGKLYLAQKKFEEAAETYKFLIEHFPGNSSYFSSLGQVYHGQKLYDRAVEAYEQAIALDQSNPKRYVNLGITLEARKHIEEAILNYRKAVDLEKENTQFLALLAEALIKKGDRAEAEVFLEQILQLEPTNHIAREKLMQLKY